MKNLISVIVTTLIIFSVTVSASMLIPAADNAKGNWAAPENSPVITDNGELTRVDFIHYVKPTSPAKTSSTSCYKLLGVKWKTFPVNYVINPSNPQGLTETFVTSTVSTSAETWDAATSKELVNNAYTVDYTAQYGVQNFQNAIGFGDYPDNNVIAVTTVWYSPVLRRIVEFDMLFNTRFRWGDATVNSTKMDLQNIGTHEFGHGVGLADIYSTSCSTVTMFGYSAYGEIDKRTLEQPDKTGLQKMYGA